MLWHISEYGSLLINSTQPRTTYFTTTTWRSWSSPASSPSWLSASSTSRSTQPSKNAEWFGNDYISSTQILLHVVLYTFKAMGLWPVFNSASRGKLSPPSVKLSPKGEVAPQGGTLFSADEVVTGGEDTLFAPPLFCSLRGWKMVLQPGVKRPGIKCLRIERPGVECCKRYQGSNDQGSNVRGSNALSIKCGTSNFTTSNPKKYLGLFYLTEPNLTRGKLRSLIA
jgi:hypothetical protein